MKYRSSCNVCKRESWNFRTNFLRSALTLGIKTDLYNKRFRLRNIVKIRFTISLAVNAPVKKLLTAFTGIYGRIRFLSFFALKIAFFLRLLLKKLLDVIILKIPKLCIHVQARVKGTKTDTLDSFYHNFYSFYTNEIGIVIYFHIF